MFVRAACTGRYGAGALWQPVKPVASFPHPVYEELKYVLSPIAPSAASHVTETSHNISRPGDSGVISTLGILMLLLVGAPAVHCRLDDLSASADFSLVQLLAFRKSVACTTGLNTVVEQHGWAGALDFGGCKEVLKDCLFDDKEEEVGPTRTGSTASSLALQVAVIDTDQA
jgi:hypothetical protein